MDTKMADSQYSGDGKEFEEQEQHDDEVTTLEEERQDAQTSLLLLQSTPYSPDPLPLSVCGAWRLFVDPETMYPYYSNNDTNESTWDPPSEWDDTLAVLPPLAELEGEMEEEAEVGRDDERGGVGRRRTSSGKEDDTSLSSRTKAKKIWRVYRDPHYCLQYFVDATTGHTQWNPPREIAHLVKEGEGAVVDWDYGEEEEEEEEEGDEEVEGATDEDRNTALFLRRNGGGLWTPRPPTDKPDSTTDKMGKTTNESDAYYANNNNETKNSNRRASTSTTSTGAHTHHHSHQSTPRETTLGNAALILVKSKLSKLAIPHTDPGVPLHCLATVGNKWVICQIGSGGAPSSSSVAVAAAAATTKTSDNSSSKVDETNSNKGEEEDVDLTGCFYFWDITTGESRWTVPESVLSAPESEWRSVTCADFDLKGDTLVVEEYWEPVYAINTNSTPTNNNNMGNTSTITANSISSSSSTVTPMLSSTAMISSIITSTTPPSPHTTDLLIDGQQQQQQVSPTLMRFKSSRRIVRQPSSLASPTTFSSSSSSSHSQISPTNTAVASSASVSGLPLLQSASEFKQPTETPRVLVAPLPPATTSVAITTTTTAPVASPPVTSSVSPAPKRHTFSNSSNYSSSAVPFTRSTQEATYSSVPISVPVVSTTGVATSASASAPSVGGLLLPFRNSYRFVSYNDDTNNNNTNTSSATTSFSNESKEGRVDEAAITTESASSPIDPVGAGLGKWFARAPAAPVERPKTRGAPPVFSFSSGFGLGLGMIPGAAIVRTRKYKTNSELEGDASASATADSSSSSGGNGIIGVSLSGAAADGANTLAAAVSFPTGIVTAGDAGSSATSNSTSSSTSDGLIATESATSTAAPLSAASVAAALEVATTESKLLELQADLRAFEKQKEDLQRAAAAGSKEAEQKIKDMMTEYNKRWETIEKMSNWLQKQRAAYAAEERKRLEDYEASTAAQRAADAERRHAEVSSMRDKLRRNQLQAQAHITDNRKAVADKAKADIAAALDMCRQEEEIQRKRIAERIEAERKRKAEALKEGSKKLLPPTPTARGGTGGGGYGSSPRTITRLASSNSSVSATATARRSNLNSSSPSTTSSPPPPSSSSSSGLHHHHHAATTTTSLSSSPGHGPAIVGGRRTSATSSHSTMTAASSSSTGCSSSGSSSSGGGPLRRPSLTMSHAGAMALGGASATTVPARHK